MSMITTALAEFDETKAAIALITEYQTWTIAINGYGQITEARKRVKRLRIDIDKRRKELNEGALTYQRAVNEEAKRLTYEIVPIEDHLRTEEEIYEAARDAEKAARDAEKAAVLQSRVNRLAEAGCVASDIAAVQAMTDDEFDWHLRSESSKAAKIREEQEVIQAAADRIEKERLEEAARIEHRKHAEALRLDAERQQEYARQAEEHQIERERLAAEREEMKKQIAEQSRELRLRQEEMLKQAAEERKLIAEQQAAIDRERAETAAKVAADRRAEDERLAAINRQQKEIARIARLEALKPEIEKAETFGNALTLASSDILASLGVPHWSVGAMESVRRCALEVLGIARGEA